MFPSLPYPGNIGRKQNLLPTRKNISKQIQKHSYFATMFPAGETFFARLVKCKQCLMSYSLSSNVYPCSCLKCQILDPRDRKRYQMPQVRQGGVIVDFRSPFEAQFPNLFWIFPTASPNFEYCVGTWKVNFATCRIKSWSIKTKILEVPPSSVADMSNDLEDSLWHDVAGEIQCIHILSSQGSTILYSIYDLIPKV